jgi:DNA replication protein DnaC
MKPLRVTVCPSPGYCPGFYLPANLPPDHPLAHQIIPCACTQAKRAAAIRAELPPTVVEMTFEAFCETGENRTALAVARRFAADPWEQGRDILTLIGPNRKGKTHLAAAIVNTLLDRGEPALFENVPELLDYLRAGYSQSDGQGFDKRFARIKDASVLVLDDLGAEANQDAPASVTWAQDKLYQIIDHRLMWQLPTVVTSNLRPDMMSARIGSRLRDERHAIVVAITSPRKTSG